MADYANYVAYDPNTKVTVTTDSIDAAAIGGTDCQLSLTRHADFYDGWNHSGSCVMSNASGAGAQVLIWGVCKNYRTDATGFYSQWTHGIGLFAKYNGSVYQLYLEEKGGSSDTSINLTGSTTYYWECRRYNDIVTVRIYSHAQRTTPIDTLIIQLSTEVQRYSVHYALCTMGAGYTATMSVICGILLTPTFWYSHPIHVGRGLPPDYDHDGESITRSGWGSSIGANTTLEASSAWSYAGTNSLHIVGSGTSQVVTSRSITAPAHNIDLSFYCKIISVADGHVARLAYARYWNGSTSTEKVMCAGVKREGSDYYWVILMKNGDSAYALSPTYRHKVDMGTVHLVTLSSMSFASGGIEFSMACNLYVDGRLVVNGQNIFYSSYQPNQIGIGSPGGESIYSNTSEIYVDVLKAYTRKITYAGGYCAMAPNGRLIVAVPTNDCIANDPNETGDVFSVDIDTGSTTHLLTLNNANVADFPYLLVSKNGVLILNHLIDQSPQNNYVLISSNSGLTWTQTDSSLTYSWLQMSRTVLTIGGVQKLLCSNVGISSGEITLAYINLSTYAVETTDIVIVSNGGGLTYSETDIFRSPATGYITAICRGDGGSGETSQRQVRIVSTDEGATWGSPQTIDSLYHVGGAAHVQQMGSDLFMDCYRLLPVAGYPYRRSSNLARIDPTTLEVLDERTLGLPDDYTTGDGNGDILCSDDGSYLFYTAGNGGSSYLFRVTYGESPVWDDPLYATQAETTTTSSPGSNPIRFKAYSQIVSFDVFENGEFRIQTSGGPRSISVGGSGPVRFTTSGGVRSLE